MSYRKIAIAVLVAGAIFVWARPASAQSFATDSAEARVNLPATLFMPAATGAPAQPASTATTDAAAGEFRQVQNSSVLNASLTGLYASTVTLQMLDVRSTYAVIQRGGAEGNPLMVGVVHNRSAFIAMKAGIAASTILAAHAMAKHSKVAAVVTLVAVNSVYASVVAHNFNLARQMR